MRIDDTLLDALADRWGIVEPDWSGQDFEAWIVRRMRYYNEFGYPREDALLWFDNFPETLWDYVEMIPEKDLIESKAESIRQSGGTFVQRIRDLKPLAKLMLS